MTLKEEFKKLVDEANEKLRLENEKRANEDRQLIEELHKRQETLLKFFSSKPTEVPDKSE